MTTVTIFAGATGWSVIDDDAARYWTPGTDAEKALSPDDFARRIATRIGATYKEPRSASVLSRCGTCLGWMATRRSEVASEQCYYCARGAEDEAGREQMWARQRADVLSLRWDRTTLGAYVGESVPAGVAA